MSQQFNDALNDCLDRLVRGEDINECLRRYPDRADELEPLLYVAQATIRAAESAKPDPDAKARNFARFSQAVEAMPKRTPPAQTSEPRRTAPRRWNWRWNWRALSRLMPWRWAPPMRPAVAAMALLLVFALGAGGVTAASEDSVPGEALYWVKTTRESVERRLPRSDDGRAMYEARLAHTRGDEMGKLIQRGHFIRADVMIKRMNNHLALSAYYAGVTVAVTPVEMPVKTAAHIGRNEAERLRHALEGDREAYRAKMDSILPHLSPEDRRRAEQVCRSAELGYWLLIDAMQTGSPNSGPYLIIKTHRKSWSR